MTPYRSLDTQPMDPRTWTPHPSNPFVRDIPKQGLDALHVPRDQHLIPALIAVRHIVPLAVQSSLPTHEFLGRGTMVSIRLPNGRMVHHRGDVHIRLYARGTDQGWGDVQLPSRTELDHLLGILFRDRGYPGVMDQLRSTYRGIRSYSVTPEEGEDIRRMYGERKGVTPDEEKEEDIGRAPPNTPDIKIGPPKRKLPFKSQLPEHPEDEEFEDGELLEEDEESRVKEEEDDDLLAEFLHINIPKDKKDDPEPTPVLSGSRSTTLAPPTLDYPDDEHNKPIDSVQTDGKHTIILDKAPTTHQTTPEPHAVAPVAQPPPPTTKTSNEVLAEIILCLLKLKYELAVALDDEASELVEEVEKDAEKLMEKKKGKGTKRGEEREKREGKKDRDGDIEMKDGGGSEEDPVPAYRSPATSEDLRKGHALASRVEELEGTVQKLKGMVMALQWKKVDDDSTLEGRMDLLEGRVAAWEIQKLEDEPAPVTARRRSTREVRETRETQERPLTKAAAQRVETRIDNLTKDLRDLRTRTRDLEREQGENGIAKRRMNEAERRIVRVEEEVEKGSKKLADIGARVEELGLRSESAIREFSQEKHVIGSSLLPRVAKLKSQVFNVNYRLVTSEEQMSFTDQKIRTLWLIGSAQNPNEAYAQTLILRNIWLAAGAAYHRRTIGAPPPSVFTNPVAHGTSTTPANVPQGHDGKPAVNPPGSASKPKTF